MVDVVFRSMILSSDKTEADVIEAFYIAQRDDAYKNRCGWSGGWSMAPRLAWPERHPCGDVYSARTMLEHDCEEWGPALVVRYHDKDKLNWMIGAYCATS